MDLDEVVTVGGLLLEWTKILHGVLSFAQSLKIKIKNQNTLLSYCWSRNPAISLKFSSRGVEEKREEKLEKPIKICRIESIHTLSESGGKNSQLNNVLPLRQMRLRLRMIVVRLSVLK